MSSNSVPVTKRCNALVLDTLAISLVGNALLLGKMATFYCTAIVFFALCCLLYYYYYVLLLVIIRYPSRCSGS